MKRILMTGLLMFASNWFRKFNPYAGAAMEMTKLKFAIGYLQTIKTVRMLFVVLLGIGVSLVLLFSGLLFVHLAIFLYAPWSMMMKMAVTLGCAAIYMSVAGAMFYNVFSEDKWLKIFNADKMIKELSGDEGSPDAPQKEGTEFARRSTL